MKVLKFGGTSVANPERIAGVAKIISGIHQKDKKVKITAMVITKEKTKTE